jgi:hypothetical protein
VLFHVKFLASIIPLVKDIILGFSNNNVIEITKIEVENGASHEGRLVEEELLLMISIHFWVVILLVK